MSLEISQGSQELVDRGLPQFPTIKPLSKYKRRKLLNSLVMGLSLFSALVGLSFLAMILYKLVGEGLTHINWALFTEDMPAATEEGGGIRNAIVGSALVTFWAIVIGTPVGILTGIYLAEFGKGSKLAKSVRFMNDILLSAPSIVIGLFIWELVVFHQKHFSGWAGALALAIIVIPVVVRTTENMLEMVPNALREAVYALGAPRYKLVLAVTLKAAKAGVITGIILAGARILGETAPLLFTAFSSNFFSTDMSQPIGNLPKMIMDYANSPYVNLQNLAWAGAFLITITVLFFNVLARYVGTGQQMKSE